MLRLITARCCSSSPGKILAHISAFCQQGAILLAVMISGNAYFNAPVWANENPARSISKPGRSAVSKKALSPKTESRKQSIPARALEPAPAEVADNSEPELFVPADLTPEEQAVTTEQAQRFAERVRRSCYEEEIELLIDAQRFGELVRNGFSASNPKAKEIAAQIGITTNRGMFSRIRVLIEQGGDYRLQKIYEDGDRKWARFRLIMTNGAVNYHEYLLMNREGEVFAEDVDVLTNGERLSATERRSIEQHLASQQLGLFGLIPGVRSPMVTHGSQILKLQELQSSNPAEAIKLYRGLPKSVQKERLAMLAAMTAAATEDSAIFVEVFEQFQKAYPEDSVLWLLAITHDAHLGRFAEARASIDKLDQLVEGDPFLDFMRGRLAYQQMDLPLATKLTQKAADAFPDLLWVHWDAVAYSLLAEDDPGTLGMLKLIDSRFEIAWNDLSSVQEYHEFAKSPEHAAWLKYLKEQGRGAARPPTENINSGQ